MQTQQADNALLMNEQDWRRIYMLISTMTKELFAHCDKPLTNASRGLLKQVWSSFFRCFKDEEARLSQTGHEDFFIHRQQHELFLDHLEWSINQALKNNRITEDLCTFIDEWLRFHHVTLDKNIFAQQSQDPAED